MTGLALTGATVYTSPDEEPLRDGVVFINDGKIAAVGNRAAQTIPSDSSVLDCSGLTITAGFWNSHVHFTERKWANASGIPVPELSYQLQDMLTSYGFTSAFDLGSSWQNTRSLRDRIDCGAAPGPRIRSTGEALVPPNALPPDIITQMMGWMKVPVPEIVDAAQARAAAQELFDAGVDAIKLFMSSPRSAGPLSDDVVHAAVSEAHRVGKPAFLHPNSGSEVLAALRCGVDVIAHTTPHSGPWDETIHAAIRNRRAALTPTLTIWKHYMRHDRASAQERATQTEVGQLRDWIACGGAVLFGNDLGAVDYDPTEEYVLMAEAGMSFREILASLTTTPAEQFGASSDLGRVAAGFKADLVVLRDDPSRNVRALAGVEYTLRDGEVIYRRTGEVRRVSDSVANREHKEEII